MKRLVFVLALGCTPATWHPAPHAGEIAIADRLVARVEVDGTDSVSTVATLDGQAAPGAVRLHGVALAAALTSPHARLARARAWQALAQMLEATPDRSYEAARLGNAELEGQAFGDDG